MGAAKVVRYSYTVHNFENKVDGADIRHLDRAINTVPATRWFDKALNGVSRG